MSNIVTYPLNGIDYDAADAAGFTATRTSGVYSSEEDFAVTAAGGLSVTVSAGVGWVHPARFEGYSVIMREAETLTLALADGQRPRIDRIVLRYDAAAHRSSLLVLQGTPDTQPTAPGISRTALLYDLCLAQITRPAGSTTIVAGNITDTRLDPALCGVMRDGVTGIPTEELIASARERINALEETASAAAKEADASKTAAAQSEANAEAYKKAAATSERNAAGSAAASAGSAAAAARSESAAAGSATSAAGSASAAEKSKTAAATSESNAAKHEEAAKKAAEEAGAKAGTDKTLSIENAPADAAATGEALGKKVDKDVILDPDGNVLFYSKAAVDKLLAGKLDLTGGTLSSTLGVSTTQNEVIDSNKNIDGDSFMRIVNSKTNSRVGFGIGDGGGTVGIFDWTKNVWIISAVTGEEGFYLYNQKCLGFVVASGSNYVRFTDGTQICWGETGQIAVRAYSTATATITYPAAFASGYPMEVSLTIAGSSENDNYSRLVLHTTERRTTNCVIYFKSVASGEMNPIAQWLAIGRWK